MDTTSLLTSQGFFTNTEIWMSFLLTLKLVCCTLVLLIFCLLPLAWALYINRKHKRAALIENILTLPMFLPPTVLGFYFLMLFKGNDIFIFNFNGILLISLITTTPVFLKGAINSFSKVGQDEVDLVRSLGGSSWEVLFCLYLPQVKHSLLRVLCLSIAQIIGSFGAILMVGGSIPGKTKVLSVLLFEMVESMSFQQANLVSILLIVIAFLVLTGLHFLPGKDNE